MGSRSPAAKVCDRMQPRAKSEASASMVSGWSGWKCCRMGAEVKASRSWLKAASASGVQVKRVALTAFRVR